MLGGGRGEGGGGKEEEDMVNDFNESLDKSIMT